MYPRGRQTDGRKQRVLMAAAARRANQRGRIISMELRQGQTVSRPSRRKNIGMEPENKGCRQGMDAENKGCFGKAQKYHH